MVLNRQSSGKRGALWNRTDTIKIRGSNNTDSHGDRDGGKVGDGDDSNDGEDSNDGDGDRH